MLIISLLLMSATPTPYSDLRASEGDNTVQISVGAPMDPIGDKSAPLASDTKASGTASPAGAAGTVHKHRSTSIFSVIFSILGSSILL